MTRNVHTTVLALATIGLAALMLACGESDTATRLEGTAPYYTSVDEALAVATEGQYIAIDFYTDW